MAVLGVVRSCVYRFRQRYFPPKMVSYPFSFAMLTDIGRARTGNEDACGASPTAGAFVVCDGMGGAAAGEIASQLATDTFLGHLTPHGDTPRTGTPDIQLDSAIQAANTAVYRQARHSRNLRGMGTTLVSLLLESDASAVTLAHVGDSRCYLLRENELHLLTRDHSLVEEQIQSGEITPEQAELSPLRNIITRAVGSMPTVEPEIRRFESYPGDLFLLASDGLTRELNDHNLLTVMRRCEQHQLPLEETCKEFIDEANDAGGGDNITVLLVRILKLPVSTEN
ncbi:protein phosphatase [Granulicella rosea]|uniref:Protein phosphatase n=1 Tax=Granulicella rosea TaxID=474952 RepID=A0A239CPX6_9BACT|nr:Stp1/IreP family PP2C-type Ser/Thr phosphatase [Granulicella rosea]SNS21443.1 protein phosphatase [Granulicella rosea]